MNAEKHPAPRQTVKYVLWNLFLISLGSVVFAIGLKAVAIHHSFITGGLFGLSLLLQYIFPSFSAGIIYAIMNIPFFLFGWRYVSKRFFYYSLFGMAASSLAYELISLHFHINDQLYAAVAAGVITGCGSGIILRSVGSAGGVDILAVILNRTFNFPVGQVYFLFNFIIFAVSFATINADLVIASMILSFISSVVVGEVMTLFSQRKTVIVVSDANQEISRELMARYRLGVTFLKGSGGYTGKERNVLLTVTNNLLLKRIEEVVYRHDSEALFIVENTFNVLGASFSKPKQY